MIYPPRPAHFNVFFQRDSNGRPEGRLQGGSPDPTGPPEDFQWHWAANQAYNQEDR